MKVILEINDPGLSQVIFDYLTANKPDVNAAVLPETVQTPIQTPVQTAVQTPPVTATSSAQPVPVTQTAPAPEQVPPQSVPTTVKSYSLDELSVAGALLMDTVGPGPLGQLIKSFGVNTLPELPKERYGEFALKLRELGAQI